MGSRPAPTYSRELSSRHLTTLLTTLPGETWSLTTITKRETPTEYGKYWCCCCHPNPNPNPTPNSLTLPLTL